MAGTLRETATPRGKWYLWLALTLIGLPLYCRPAVAQNVIDDQACKSLDAAVKTALDTRIPPAKLDRFGGRFVSAWRPTDLDAFIAALSTCQQRPDVAPILNAFPDEALELLTEIRARAPGKNQRSLTPLESAARAASDASNAVVLQRAGTRSDLPSEIFGTKNWQEHVAAVTSELDRLEYIGTPPSDVFEALNPLHEQLSKLQVDAMGISTVQSRTDALAVVESLKNRAYRLGDAWRGQQRQQQQQTDTRLTSNTVASPPPTMAPDAPATPRPTEIRASTPSPDHVAHSTLATSPTEKANGTDETGGGINGLIVVLWILLVIVGSVAGWRQDIVVFRNYDDLALVFFVGFAFVVGMFLAAGLGGGKDTSSPAIVLIATAIGVLGLFGWLLVRTWIDNPSLWRCPLALLTKLSLAVLFLINLVSLIAPGGKNQYQRSRRRSAALGFLLILSPIVYGLVRDKTGMWAPRDVLGTYHRRRFGM